MERSDACVEKFDIEGVLGYAEAVLSNAARLWVGASLDQQLRLQAVLSPEGVTFDGKKFGTAITCLTFSHLPEIRDSIGLGFVPIGTHPGVFRRSAGGVKANRVTVTPMWDRATWQFINSFAPWLSALGTLAVVIVSLYLVLRASRLDIRVSAAIVILLGEPNSRKHEYLRIRAVNHGRAATVTGIGWSVLGSKQQWVVLPPNDPYSTKLPARLDFGEEANVLFQTASFNKLGKSLLDHVNRSKFPRLTVRLLRVGVFASTGQRFRVALDDRLRQFLLERSKQIPND